MKQFEQDGATWATSDVTPAKGKGKAGGAGTKRKAATKKDATAPTVESEDDDKGEDGPAKKKSKANTAKVKAASTIPSEDDATATDKGEDEAAKAKVKASTASVKPAPATVSDAGESEKECPATPVSVVAEEKPKAKRGRKPKATTTGGDATVTAPEGAKKVGRKTVPRGKKDANETKTEDTKTIEANGTETKDVKPADITTPNEGEEADIEAGDKREREEDATEKE
jgi:hypothetical protein